MELVVLSKFVGISEYFQSWLNKILTSKGGIDFPKKLFMVGCVVKQATSICVFVFWSNPASFQNLSRIGSYINIVWIKYKIHVKLGLNIVDHGLIKYIKVDSKQYSWKVTQKYSINQYNNCKNIIYNIHYK